jgi:hypothetical protein
VFDLKFALFVEADLASGGEGALAILVEFENDDAERVIAGAGGVVEFAKGDGAVGHQDDVETALFVRAYTDETHAGADVAGGLENAEQFLNSPSLVNPST